jgi:hypothetical protein
MRDVYREYKENKISWDEAFLIANNLAATACVDPETEESETDFYASQMESLGVDAAEHIMTLLGYKQDNSGIYFKPGDQGTAI